MKLLWFIRRAAFGATALDQEKGRSTFCKRGHNVLRKPRLQPSAQNPGGQRNQEKEMIMRKLIHSVLIAGVLLTSVSAAMAAPRQVYHSSQPRDGFTTNSSESAWKWWDDEADHR
jgi:hypothetical protein